VTQSKKKAHFQGNKDPSSLDFKEAVGCISLEEGAGGVKLKRKKNKPSPSADEGGEEMSSQVKMLAQTKQILEEIIEE